MANYYAASRTSYVKVKDEDDFLSWANTVPDCEIIEKEKSWEFIDFVDAISFRR